MIVLLDSSPLGGITSPNKNSPTKLAMEAWAKKLYFSGHELMVPAIADFELRREHIRRNATASISELDAFVHASENRYLPITDTALKLAAELWAKSHNMGLPSAEMKELDCDILIAAQALDLGLSIDDFVIATSNIRHLSRFVPCKLWHDINL